MIISHDQKFIFVKTVKTGGSQVELALAPYLSNRALQTIDTVGGQFSEVRNQYRRVTRLPIGTFLAMAFDLVVDSPERKNALKGIASSLISRRGPSIQALSIEKNHMAASEIRNLVGTDAYSRYFKTAIVRHPYNRIASAFWRTSKIKDHRDILDRIGLQKSFYKWLNENPEIFSVNQRILIDVNKPNGVDLLVDHVIRYENLETSLVIFADYLKIDLGQLTQRFRTLPARNPSRPTNFSIKNLYSAESLSIVNQQAAWEFETFGYDSTSLIDDV
jgi:hypothetical protein